MARPRPLVLALLRVLRAIVRRFYNSIKQVAAIRQEPIARVWLALGVTIGVLLLVIWWRAPNLIGSLSINLLAGAIGGIVGVYFSLEVIRPYIRTIERQRIDPAKKILNTYETIYKDDETAYPNFIRLDEIEAWEDSSLPHYAEKTIEYLPGPVGQVLMRGIEPEAPLMITSEQSEIRPLDSFSCVLAKREGGDGEGIDSEALYTVPEGLGSLLEPYYDDIRQMFLEENRRNEPKVRLDEYRDGTFVFSKTTYYRSFLTNFCPDYPTRNEAPIRTLTAPLLFDEDGDALPLSESPFSNHFGGGGLVVTTDGKILLSVRGKTVAVEGNSKHLSFSGSFDYETVAKDGLRAEIEAILKDETGIESSSIVEVCTLGVTRRIERLGKPDLVTLVLVDEDVSWGAATNQFVAMDAVPVSPDADLRIDSIAELFEGNRPYTATRSLVSHLDERAYPPSLGLVSAIYLMDSLAD